jgi:hypothetical protein
MQRAFGWQAASKGIEASAEHAIKNFLITKRILYKNHYVDLP